MGMIRVTFKDDRGRKLFSREIPTAEPNERTEWRDQFLDEGFGPWIPFWGLLSFLLFMPLIIHLGEKFTPEEEEGPKHPYDSIRLEKVDGYMFVVGSKRIGDGWETEEFVLSNPSTPDKLYYLSELDFRKEVYDLSVWHWDTVTMATTEIEFRRAPVSKIDPEAHRPVRRILPGWPPTEDPDLTREILRDGFPEGAIISGDAELSKEMEETAGGCP